MKIQEIKEGFGNLLDSVAEGWHHLRESAANALTRFKPGQQTQLPAREEIDDPLYLPARGWSMLGGEVFEDVTRLVVRLEMPGMDKQNIAIDVRDDALVVSGEKRFERESTEGRWRVMQCAYARSIRLQRELGNLSGLAFSLYSLSIFLILHGDFSSPLPMAEEALSIFQRLGNSVGEANALTIYGHLAFFRNEYQDSTAYVKKAIELNEKNGDLMPALYNRRELAMGLLHQGYVEEAKELLYDCVNQFQKLNAFDGLAKTIDTVASLLVRQEDPVRAALLIAWAGDLRQKSRSIIWPMQGTFNDEIRAKIRTMIAMRLEPEPEPEPEIIPQPYYREPEPQPIVHEEEDRLTSAATEAAAASALAGLVVPKIMSSTGLEGLTVESIVRELLRPMLREWMDNNLPTLVERLVEAEIERLSRRPRL